MPTTSGTLLGRPGKGASLHSCVLCSNVSLLLIDSWSRALWRWVDDVDDQWFCYLLVVWPLLTSLSLGFPDLLGWQSRLLRAWRASCDMVCNMSGVCHSRGGLTSACCRTLLGASLPPGSHGALHATLPASSPCKSFRVSFHSWL